MKHNAARASGPATVHAVADDPHPQPWTAFGARVRQARERAGLSREDIALRDAYSPTLIARVESGTDDGGRALVDYLDRTLDTGGRLLDAWARALITSHLSEGSPVEQLQRHAHQIREFQPRMIPEFFHTEAYARALCDAARPAGRGISGRQRDRMRTVHRHPTDPTPPYFCVVLDEAAIHTTVGNHETTREQLRHLLKLVRSGHLTLHVIPERTRTHPCRLGPFRHLAFSAHHTLTYLPAACTDGHLLSEPDTVAAYADLFATLQGAALPPDTSVELLETAIHDQPQAITAARATTGTSTTTADTLTPTT